MSQEQPSSRLHYKALIRECGFHRALEIAADDVDSLREELGRKLDRLGVFAFGIFLAGGLVGGVIVWVCR